MRVNNTDVVERGTRQNGMDVAWHVKGGKGDHAAKDEGSILLIVLKLQNTKAAIIGNSGRIGVRSDQIINVQLATPEGQSNEGSKEAEGKAEKAKPPTGKPCDSRPSEQS